MKRREGDDENDGGRQQDKRRREKRQVKMRSGVRRKNFDQDNKLVKKKREGKNGVNQNVITPLYHGTLV